MRISDWSSDVCSSDLAGVGVADDGDALHPATTLRLALGRAVLVDLAELGLELVDPSLDAASIDLELGLAGAAGTDAGTTGGHSAALLRERRALAADAREPVLEQRQLDLGLALHAVGVLGEDVEDHRRAVDGGAPEQLTEVALLGQIGRAHV